MVSVILPLSTKMLSSFLFTGNVPVISRFASSPAEGARNAFISCGEELMGPFEICGTDSGSVFCRISEPVRRIPYRRTDIPTRISDSMASKLLSGAEKIPPYAGVTGSSEADGLLASAEGGTIRFVSENWDVVRHCASVLGEAGVSFSMASASEISVGDAELCSRCAAIPEASRISDDGFMSGFLAPRVRSGRIYGCPEWARGACGGKVLVASDRYGNPAVSAMSSGVYPFGILAAEPSGGAGEGVPESFMFAAAETVYRTALEFSGYEVSCIWEDSLSEMLSAVRGGSRFKVIVLRRLCDSSVSQLRNHACGRDAAVVALDPRIREAPFLKVEPLLGVKGFDWAVAEGMFAGPGECGPEICKPALEEAERFLGIIWGS